MSTHKRKGSDFRAASVATVNTSSVQNQSSFGLFNVKPNHSSTEEGWETLQQKMQEMRSSFVKKSEMTMKKIDNLLEQPRLLQERIENLPYEAAGMEEKLDAELSDLKQKWEIKSERESVRQERLRELRAEQESLQVYSDELDADLHDTRDAIASFTFRQRLSREVQTQKVREMSFKIPKLQQQISMYAMCTGIKWDYDNKEAWVGNVVRT